MLEEERTTTASQRYRRGQITGLDKLAQNVIDNMGETGTEFVQRTLLGQGASQHRRVSQHTARSQREQFRRETNYDEEEAPMTQQGQRPYREPDTEVPYLQGRRIERSGHQHQVQQNRRSAPAVPDTADDYSGPIARTTKPPQSVLPSRRVPSRGQGVHPLVWVGLTMLVLLVLWVTIPMGESWWVGHVTDPGQFGPMHGSITTGVFGGGDSEAKPSKLFGFNDEGKIRIIMFHGDDAAHSQVLVGPDLLSQDSSDLKNAQVELQTADVNHDGNLDLRVTILGASFDASFQRVKQTYILYGDGKGNLKREPPQPSGGAS